MQFHNRIGCDYPLNLWQIHILFRRQRFPHRRPVITDFFAAVRTIAKRFVGLWIDVAGLIALATFPRSIGAAMPEFNPSPLGLRLNPFRQRWLFLFDSGHDLKWRQFRLARLNEPITLALIVPSIRRLAIHKPLAVE